MLDKNNDDLVSIEEFQELLHIGRTTAYHLLTSGEIRAFKIGKCWKIPRIAITEYISRKSKISLQ